MEPLSEEELLYGSAEEAMYEEDPTPAPDEIQANYHLRRCTALEAQATMIGDVFDREIEALKARKEEALSPLASRLGWHLKAVEGWHRANYAAKTVGKTVKLPGGTSKLRASQPKLEIVDEDAFRAWASTIEVGETPGGKKITVEDQVYEVKEPALGRAALKKAVQIVGADKAEPGSTVSAVHPETGAKVPGMRWRVGADRHDI